MNVPRELIKIAKLITSARAEQEVEKFLKAFLPGTPFAHKAFAVGGYVRDQMLGLEAKDLDIVVEMKDGAEKLTKFLRKQLGRSVSTPRQLGAGYPIWQITFKDNITFKDKTYRTKGAIIEFADTMTESFPDPKTRQRQTEFGTIEQDVERRDFTVNMLMKDLTDGEVKDFTGVSKSDLEKGILRGHPGVSLDKIFANDPLRMIRLIRFQTKYGWKIPLSVLKTVKRNAKRIRIVSSERIMEELKKVMKLGKLDKAIRLMKITGLLKYVLPEVDELSKVQQDVKHHAEGSVFKHTLMVLKNAKPTVEAQMAALLHDVGKKDTQEVIGDSIKFQGHEEVSGEIAEAILRRLKFDVNTIKRVKTVVENHMRPHRLGDEVLENPTSSRSQKMLRRFVRRVGDEFVDAVLDLAEADALGKLPPENYIPKLREMIEDVSKSPLPVSRKPVLDGREIMRLLGIEAGPLVGEVGRFLLELQDEFASEGKALTKSEAEKRVLQQFGARRKATDGIPVPTPGTKTKIPSRRRKYLVDIKEELGYKKPKEQKKIEEVANELAKIAKLLIGIDLDQYGEFSRPARLYFHSFNKPVHLTKALRMGKFGRSKLTLIGTQYSKGVPYRNQIWFRKPIRVEIFPTFYTTKSDEAFAEIKQELANRFNVGITQAQVGGSNFAKEQEWYYPGMVPLSKLDVAMVVYDRNTSDEQKREIVDLADRWGFSHTEFPWQ